MGNVVNQKETVKNRFKFTGEQLDPIIQQYYLRARFYNPVIVRFTQEDTYIVDELNLYAYCRNNPIKYTILRVIIVVRILIYLKELRAIISLT